MNTVIGTPKYALILAKPFFGENNIFVWSNNFIKVNKFNFFDAKCYTKWSALYVYSMNPSQYRAGMGHFIKKSRSCDRTWVIYILLFIYGTILPPKDNCGRGRIRTHFLCFRSKYSLLQMTRKLLKKVMDTCWVREKETEIKKEKEDMKRKEN